MLITKAFVVIKKPNGPHRKIINVGNLGTWIKFYGLESDDIKSVKVFGGITGQIPPKFINPHDGGAELTNDSERGPYFRKVLKVLTN